MASGISGTDFPESGRSYGNWGEIMTNVQSASKDSAILIDLRALQSRYLPISRTTIWRMVHSGKLPKPIKLAPGRGGRLLWRREAIEAAINALETGRAA
jgi:predicted DNA-binding transcriptional regulator AlpA